MHYVLAFFYSGCKQSNLSTRIFCKITSFLHNNTFKMNILFIFVGKNGCTFLLKALQNSFFKQIFALYSSHFIENLTIYTKYLFLQKIKLLRMSEVKKFVFNNFQINTYIIFDETLECIIIDPGCSDKYEEAELFEFIEANNLTPKMMINTHWHVDHVVGNNAVCKKYSLTPICDSRSEIFWTTIQEFGSVIGMNIPDPIIPNKFVKDKEIIRFGNTNLEVRYTPGHAEGSICLVNHEDKYIITGDVIFNNSIGRTDLPTGDFDVLIKSIKDKIFSLADDFTIYSGHGPSSTVGFEKKYNPFLF